MLEFCKVALTGPLAAGKSTALQHLKELGAFVVSADQIVHKLLSPQTDLGKKILQLLGEEVLVEGKFDRVKISDKVFSDPSLLKKYEALLHPQVQKEIERIFLKEAESHAVCIAEIPLLYEAHLQDWYDAVVYVTAPKERRKERYCKQEGRHLADFEKREKRLIPDEDKKKLANYCLENSSSEEELKNQMKTIYQQLKLLRTKL